MGEKIKHSRCGKPLETYSKGLAAAIAVKGCFRRFQEGGGLKTNTGHSSDVCSLCRYILASFYTKYDATHFFINTCSLLTVLIPKLPQLHGVRIFGINKY
ncbi:hypothetical protein AMECASPLE_020163 [Ameca splendens]|uniref:Uncharacterized protein n=1 Tax=Ameca splendens TaxID=208324 RepID=A0ABV0YET1_9TELE